MSLVKARPKSSPDMTKKEKDNFMVENRGHQIDYDVNRKIMDHYRAGSILRDDENCLQTGRAVLNRIDQIQTENLKQGQLSEKIRRI